MYIGTWPSRTPLIPIANRDIPNPIRAVLPYRPFPEREVAAEICDRFGDALDEAYARWYPKAKPYSDHLLASEVFKVAYLTRDEKAQAKYDLAALRTSVRRQADRVREAALRQEAWESEFDLVREFSSEALALLERIEAAHTGEDIFYGVMKRDVLGSQEVFAASGTMLRRQILEGHISDFPVRPTAVFLIRQAMELRLKNMLGIHVVMDTDGRPIKLSGFIFLDLVKRYGSEIEFPLPEHVVRRIYEWTNYPIHGGLVHPMWQTEFARHVLGPLFEMGRHEWGDGRVMTSNHGTIKIHQSLLDRLDDVVAEAMGKAPEDIIISRLHFPECIVI